MFQGGGTACLTCPDPKGEANEAHLNGSLTIIVLTPLTTFSERSGNCWPKYLIGLGYFHRGIGARWRPRACASPWRRLALSCRDLDRLECARPRPKPDPRVVPSGARRLLHATGIQ